MSKDLTYIETQKGRLYINEYVEELKKERDPANIHAFLIMLGHLVGEIEALGGSLCDLLEEIAPNDGWQYFRDYVI